MEDKLLKLIEKYKNETAKECYKFICVDGEISILDDKLGGNPYLPIGEDYPIDSEGNPMPLLIQINLKNIELDGWCKSGILEIFLDKNVDYPCQYVIKYFEEGLEYQTEFPEIDLERFIVEKPIKIELSRDICHMPLTDYRAIEKICSLVNEIYETNIESRFDLDNVIGCKWYSKISNAINNPFGTIGGYADFTQEDPRADLIDDKDECLVKLDSCLDSDKIYIGDAGILFVLISEWDLKNGNFDEAIVDWDCC